MTKPRELLPLLDIFKAKWRYDAETGTFTVKRTGAVCDAKFLAGYARLTHLGKQYMAHRVAWLMHYEEEPPAIMDHVNRKRDDNRITNLRPATHAQNARNIVRRSKLGWKGAYVHHSGWFYALCKPQAGRLTNLGIYRSAVEAAFAYNVAAGFIDAEHSTINDIPDHALTAEEMQAIREKVAFKLGVVSKH